MENKVKKIMGSIIIPVLEVFGIITIYKHLKAKKKNKLQLQYLNQYESQGFVIANGTEISNRYNSIVINQPIDYNNKRIVKRYMEQMVTSLGNDIKLARYNFSTLKVIYDKSLLLTGAAGTYNGSENIIKYYKNNASILGHEMLHMASYMYNPSTCTHHHGFMQQKDKVKIGCGLNEGYTELLSSRMFNNGKVYSYKRLVRIVKLLEDFFPNKNELSHYYFTCDLPAFILNLRRYCTTSEIKEILHGLDKLYEYEYIHGSPVAVVLETQLASKLYNIYQRNFISEPAKVEAFKHKASENKLTAMVISDKKMRVNRTNPFTRIKNGIQTGFRKIKKFFTGTPQPTSQPAYAR